MAVYYPKPKDAYMEALNRQENKQKRKLNKLRQNNADNKQIRDCHAQINLYINLWARFFHEWSDEANPWEWAIIYDAICDLIKYLAKSRQDHKNEKIAELTVYGEELLPYYNAIKLFRAAALEISKQDAAQRKKQLYNDLIWAAECLNIPGIKMSTMSIRRKDIVSEVANYAMNWEMADAQGMSQKEWERCCEILEQIEADYTITWEERISGK